MCFLGVLLLAQDMDFLSGFSACKGFARRGEEPFAAVFEVFLGVVEKTKEKGQGGSVSRRHPSRDVIDSLASKTSLRCSQRTRKHHVESRLVAFKKKYCRQFMVLNRESGDSEQCYSNSANSRLR